MTSDERRAEIVRATLPLLRQHGANVTTGRIAHAAGVAEGTIFRVFAGKEELLRACIAEVFRTDVVSARVRRISPGQSLDEQLTEAGELLAEHFGRLGDLMHSLAATGYDVHQYRARQHPPEEAGAEEEGPAAFVRELVEAITYLLGRDEHGFQLAAEDVARMLLGLLFSLRFEPQPPEDRRAMIAKRVHALLHGALRR